MGLRAEEGELEMQGHFQPCRRVWMTVPMQVFSMGLWHEKLLSVQSGCCWNKTIKNFAV